MESVYIVWTPGSSGKRESLFLLCDPMVQSAIKFSLPINKKSFPRNVSGKSMCRVVDFGSS